MKAGFAAVGRHCRLAGDVASTVPDRTGQPILATAGENAPEVDPRQPAEAQETNPEAPSRPGTKRTRSGQRVPKRPTAAKPVDKMGVAALRAELLNGRCRIQQLEERVAQLEHAAAGVAAPTGASGPQHDTEQTLRDAQTRLDTQQADAQRDHHALHCQVVQMQQELAGLRQQTAAAAQSQAQLQEMQKDISMLDLRSRRNNIVMHAPAACTSEQLITQLNQRLQSGDASAGPLPSSALRPMRTDGAASGVWHLTLGDRGTKHALFSHSKELRQQKIFLDDELTRQQMRGRQQLTDKRLQLKQQGCSTWWRQDTLCWAADGVVHKLRPS